MVFPAPGRPTVKNSVLTPGSFREAGWATTAFPAEITEAHIGPRCPGGFSGWNLDALDDCLRGGWGATTPFTLHWDSSAEARTRLAECVAAGDRELVPFDLLLEIFEARGVSVILR
ncbi:barstar family protein [Peterkaempfera griseoplana]|uniref:barstar family protein n=1 Tax=Peterkaempfera griseoplana TaxID=66896 RepID=UPI002AFF72D4|nr:barstar family protein [Peterkaempfera griseoplana]